MSIEGEQRGWVGASQRLYGAMPVKKPNVFDPHDWNRVAAYVAFHHRIPIYAIMGQSRKPAVCRARDEVAWRIRFDTPGKKRPSYEKIGVFLHRDHSTIMHSIANYRERNKCEPKR